MSYSDVYERWREDPEGFWMEAARAIDWEREPSRAFFADGDGRGSWFADGRLNGCWNAVDRHVLAGRGEQVAILHDSPITDSQRRITYRELQEQVATLAGALAASGVEQGDRVLVYMPMVPEALVAMLACARIGAIHSVVFGGFAAKELAVRVDDATPKVVLAATHGFEPGRVVPYKPLLDEALRLASHAPQVCVLLRRGDQAFERSARDVDWVEFQRGAAPADCVAVEATHPAYILYTSGTTGAPKGVVRDTGGHLVALHWTMKNVYGVDPGEVFWAASDVGWVVGHSYICYGPLVHGNTTIVYEGKPVGTPDAGAFWRVIAEHRVRTFFTAPTAFRAVKREDPAGELVQDYDLACLGAVFLAGERADPDTIHWAEDRLGVPVIDHWWQTETGFPIAANPLGIEALPIKVGSPTVAMPGYEVLAVDEAGVPLPPGELGAIVITLPLPPGTLPTLWKADARFQDSYLTTFPGRYETGDAGVVDEDGYVFIMARTDDVINVAGHRLSTGGMEEVLAGHPDVAECAVIGVADSLKGQLPVGFLCLNSGCDRDPGQIVAEVVQRVREQIGPVAAFKRAAVVERLPKTRSGKMLRGTMAKLADGVPFEVPATIDDPTVLEEIRAALRSLGLAASDG